MLSLSEYRAESCVHRLGGRLVPRWRSNIILFTARAFSPSSPLDRCRTRRKSRSSDPETYRVESNSSLNSYFVRYHTGRYGVRMSLAAALRHDLSERARKFALTEALPHSLSYGETPVVCFASPEHGTRHGNFLRGSYKAIQANPAWRKRLEKVHTRDRRSLPPAECGCWKELDSCTSSDALLMNIFCHPSLLRDGTVAALLGSAPGMSPCFGYKARVPLANGRFDRTEVDLRLGDLLIEAKLTENDFQSAKKKVLLAYRDFSEVFDLQRLPETGDRYLSYQLLRNVLAAHALQCSFCVLVDARRPDLADAWYAVMSCVQPVELRTKLKILTWQEVAQLAPPTLRAFLAAKYGIGLPANHRLLET
jgi:hypothetical protein